MPSGTAKAPGNSSWGHVEHGTDRTYVDLGQDKDAIAARVGLAAA
jgi:hypothetical protein